jgi:hypothetical protein
MLPAFRPGLVGVAFAGVIAVTAFAHDTRIDMTRLPLGDGRLSHAPKVDWIWVCHVDPAGGGAQHDGPWINERDGTWDATKKITVSGAVRWPHSFKITVVGDKRVFSANDLPNHPTGIFPIRSSEPAYRYDRNPNHIRSQRFRFTLPAMPVLQQSARCAPNAVGILVTGVVLFNSLDARDATRWRTRRRTAVTAIRSSQTSTTITT